MNSSGRQTQSQPVATFSTNFQVGKSISKTRAFADLYIYASRKRKAYRMKYYYMIRKYKRIRGQ